MQNRTSEQEKGIQKTVIIIVVVVFVILGLFINRILTPRELSPKEMVSNGAIMFSTPREISDFELTDKNDQPFTKENLKGHWTLIFFGFTHCPDICPATLALFGDIKEELRETPYYNDTRFLFVTLDPARDTVEKINEYLKYFDGSLRGAPDDWLNGVTGEFLTLRKFATQVNVPFQKVVLNHDIGDYTIDHSGNLIVINPYGHFHGIYRPPLDVKRIALTYRSLRIGFDKDNK